MALESIEHYKSNESNVHVGQLQHFRQKKRGKNQKIFCFEYLSFVHIQKVKYLK